MIKLRDNLLVSAHMIVGIELAEEDGKDCINVHSPDGSYWSIDAEDLHVPAINDGLLTALANEIDRQCKEMGVAAFMDAKVKEAIEQRISDDTRDNWNMWNKQDKPAHYPPIKPPGYLASRQLDDEIPF